MKVVKLFVAVATCALIGQGFARAERPFQLALWPPDIQLVDESESIHGLRLEVYGRNKDVTGVDLGFVHETTGFFHGVDFGLASMVGGEMAGLQWNMLYSQTTGEARGWSAGFLTHVGPNSRGLLTSAVSFTDGEFTGLQLSFIYSEAKTHITGLQTGLFNHATDIEGVQLGFINIADDMYGVQIGLWNEIKSKKEWSVIPLVNWNF